MSKLRFASINPAEFPSDSDEETLDEMAALAESGIIIGDFSPQAEGRPEPLGEAAAKPTEDLTVKGSSSEWNSQEGNCEGICRPLFQRILQG